MTTHDKTFPNESAAYRVARDKVLQKEIELRAQIEELNELRRALPLGGEVTGNYEFRRVDDDTAVKFSQLFAPGKDTAVLYSFMFAPDAAQPCTSCNAIADSFDGNAPHLDDRVNFYIVTKAPVAKMRAWAETRGWRHLQLLSSTYNYYNRDYLAENDEGFQMPMLNVFVKRPEGIFHTYGTELLYAKFEKGDPRHVDMLWPLWNVFDLTPEGRGGLWYPKHVYKPS
ncbi:MAG: DUF899 family protein [Agarilytica sp.]